MDTGTHVVMGFGLAGLSALDPIVSHHTITSEAVMFGVVFGSVIPDIDTVLKLKDNATYIRNHRGLTHSIPATIIWPIIIMLVVLLFLPHADMAHLWLWTFLAVFLHVFVDIFNAYGTQALRPLTYRWIALCIINIFDPVIFGSHIIGFILWSLIGHSGVIFLTLYGLLICYYVFRTFHYKQALSIVRKQLHDATNIYLSPTLRWHQYHVAAKSASYYYVGEVKQKQFQLFDQFERTAIPKHVAVNVAKKDENIKAFLSFSPIYRLEMEDTGELYEIRFYDLRYFAKGHYPFVAIARVSYKMEILSSFTGWIYNKEKLEKKLHFQDDCPQH